MYFHNRNFLSLALLSNLQHSDLHHASMLSTEFPSAQNKCLLLTSPFIEHSYAHTEQHSLCGADPFGSADCAGADSVSLPHQASVLGLLRTGFGDAQQRRPPGDRRRAEAQDEARVHPRTEPEPQSRSQKYF